MNASQRTQSNDLHSVLATICLAFGVLAQIFPAISIVFLVTQNGGAGYVQSLVCGTPIATIGITAGVAVLVQDRTQARRVDWRAVTGMGLSGLFFLAALVLIAVLLAPFALWGDG